MKKIIMLSCTLLLSLPLTAMKQSEENQVQLPLAKEIQEQDLDGRNFNSLSEALMTGQFCVTNDSIQFADYEDENKHFVTKFKNATTAVYKEFTCFIDAIDFSHSKINEIKAKLADDPGAQLKDDELKQLQLSRLTTFLLNEDINTIKRKQKKELARNSNQSSTSSTDREKKKNMKNL